MRDANEHAIVDAQVNWSSSDSEVAKVSQDGLVTAVSSGTAQIAAASGDASAEATVSVSLPVPFRIEIAPDSETLAAVGDTIQLQATVYDANDQVITDAEIDWSSSDESVASVDTTGLVSGVSSGTAMITATSGEVTASIEVLVAPPVVEVTLAPSSPPTLTALGETLQMTATPRDAKGQPMPWALVTWTSSHPTVATVNDSGLVTATGNGGARITATSGEMTASLIVTVSQVAVQVVITPASPRLSVGYTLQLTANVLDANDGRLRGAAVTWDSRNPSVATVSVTGLVQAVANGSTRITATSGDLSGTVQVVVEPGHEEGGGGITLESDGSLETDREGLIALYNALDGDNWTDKTNWLSEEPLNTWAGVTYYDNLDRVGSVDLRRQGLNGSLPSELAKIDLLSNLYLSHNSNLTGPIPSAIGQLRYLRLLYLEDTSVSGPMPSEILQLENLKHLFILSEEFSGILPAGLSRMTQLQVLYLRCNLTGTIPSDFGQLTNLLTLVISNGELTGGIPSSLGQLRKLETLGFDGNNLSGNIPAELGQIEPLYNFGVTDNPNMSGTLPHQLTNLTNVFFFEVTGTQLCAPTDPAFQAWLATITFHDVPTCQ